MNEAVRSEQDLADYMAKEQQIRDPLDQVQYKVVFFPNLSEKEVAFMFKAHHCIADGLAMITLLMNLQD